MRKSNLKYIFVMLMMFLPSFATEQTKDDPIYLFSLALSEIVQVFLSMWRIIYVTFEIFALMFVLLILPILVFKTIKWGINEVFNK